MKSKNIEILLIVLILIISIIPRIEYILPILVTILDVGINVLISYGYKLIIPLIVLACIYHWRTEASKTIENMVTHVNIIKRKIKDDNENNNEEKDFTVQHNSTNNGMAKVFANGKVKIYFSTSSVAEGSFSTDYDMTLCTSEEIIKDNFKVKRLAPNLEWEVYAIEGHAGKNKCCERKLLGYILNEYDNDGSLEEIEVILYTELEPCIYCYNAMKELKKERNLDLTVYFQDMINEIKNDPDYANKLKLNIKEIKDIELEFQKSKEKIKQINTKTQ